MKLLKKILMVSVAVTLVACGGGGGNPGTTPGSGTGTKDVANFEYQLDKNTVTNSGTDQAVLTITALDSNNNPVTGVPLAVVVDSGIYTPVVATTDTSGKASGNITIGSAKSNRSIKFTMTVGSKTKSDVLAVTGSQVTLGAVPAAPAPSAPVSVSVKVADVNGTGIANTDVSLTGTLGFSQTLKTDASGNAVANIAAAPAAPGNYTVQAVAAGVTVSRDVQVASASGGIPNAVGVISAASLAITPNTIAPNTSGSVTNRAGLRAIFLNSANQAIRNVRVRFEILPPGLGSGEQLSSGSAVVYTDVNGVATADYIAGTRASPTNGVSIRACFGNTDADVANGACTNSRTATMTVASEPLSITLGDNNELQKGGDNLTYIKKFDVAVADAAGNAIANAQISASVDLIRYGKGAYAGPRISCLNEDKNRNGQLDVGEDVDGDGILTPRKADVIISYVGSRTTGTNGRATIQVEYPQNVATWLEYAVKVTTSVAGSEGTVEKSYVTSFVEGDDKNGSFLTPPYGVDSCSIPK